MRTPAPQKPIPPWAQPLSFKVAGVQDYDVLYIRSGPSQDHSSVGMIPPTGRGIVITGRCRDDWCPIRHRNVSGWVNRYYLAQDLPRYARGPIPDKPLAVDDPIEAEARLHACARRVPQGTPNGIWHQEYALKRPAQLLHGAREAESRPSTR